MDNYKCECCNQSFSNEFKLNSHNKTKKHKDKYIDYITNENKHLTEKVNECNNIIINLHRDNILLKTDNVYKNSNLNELKKEHENQLKLIRKLNKIIIKYKLKDPNKKINYLNKNNYNSPTLLSNDEIYDDSIYDQFTYCYEFGYESDENKRITPIFIPIEKNDN